MAAESNQVVVGLENIHCTVSPDDIVTLLNQDGKEIFRQHQPGAYRLMRQPPTGISVGIRDGRVGCVTLVADKRA